MDNITKKDIDWLLNLNESGISGSSDLQPKKNSGKRKLWVSLLAWLLLLFTCGVLPFYLLIRTSVFLNVAQGWNAWLSLGGGIIAAITLLLVYVFILFRKLENRNAILKLSTYGLSVLVFSFSVYGVMYLSSVHAKNDEIRQVYRSLHPILRMAVTTTTLADNDLVITDISRIPEDYEAMGLPLNERSLHFVQETGYVHAVDLRTMGRSEFRNILLRFSLEILGLNTIRHTGTADHLHVALPLRR
jgi:hypothetical protein